jgi:hypothetical protein
MAMDPSGRIPSFSPIAKLFVGLFTTLMLLVCVWAAWLYTVSKGTVDESHLPAYLSQQTENELTPEEEIEAIASDSETVLAPIWDMEHAGEAEPLDSTQIDSMEELAEAEEAQADQVIPLDQGNIDEPFVASETRLRHNLGLAHTHVNGQTLLFFALGAVFLFTSVKPKTKKIMLWLFGIAILVHAVGLSGQGFYSFFDDILAISGVVLLLLIAYMALMIYVDLGKKPRTEEK